MVSRRSQSDYADWGGESAWVTVSLAGTQLPWPGAALVAGRVLQATAGGASIKEIGICIWHHAN